MLPCMIRSHLEELTAARISRLPILDTICCTTKPAAIPGVAAMIGGRPRSVVPRECGQSYSSWRWSRDNQWCRRARCLRGNRLNEERKDSCPSSKRTQRPSRDSTRRSPTPSGTSTARGSRGSPASTRARQVVEQRGTIPVDYTVAREAADGLLPAPARTVRREEEHHHLRPVLARPGRDDEADGHRGHLPRRLGDVGQGLDHRGPGPRPRQLSAEPGARRGRRPGARPAHRRPQPAVPAAADDRGAARRDARGRLPAVHHRRRRHRPRRRSRTCAT